MARGLRAKFCSPAHRQANHRAKNKGNGRTWHDVSEIYKIQATEVGNLSPLALERINQILRDYGATAAINAIAAAYEISNVVFSLWEDSK